jgi:hypothetical protein
MMDSRPCVVTPDNARHPADRRNLGGMRRDCRKNRTKRRFVIREKSSLDRPGRWRGAGKTFPGRPSLPTQYLRRSAPTTGTVERLFGTAPTTGTVERLFGTAPNVRHPTDRSKLGEMRRVRRWRFGRLLHGKLRGQAWTSRRFRTPDLALSLSGNRDVIGILLRDLCAHSAVRRSSDLPQRTLRAQRIVAPSQIP